MADREPVYAFLDLTNNRADLFRKSGDALVRFAQYYNANIADNATTHPNTKSGINWYNDGENFGITMAGTANTLINGAALTREGVFQNSWNSPAMDDGYYEFFDKQATFLRRATSQTTGQDRLPSSAPNGTAGLLNTVGTANNYPSATIGVLGQRMSPDKEMLVRFGTTVSSTIFSTNPVAQPVGHLLFQSATNNYTALPYSTNSQIADAEWTANSQFIILADIRVTGHRLFTYEKTSPTALVYRRELAFTGTHKALAVSGRNDRVAHATESGGIITTRIYSIAPATGILTEIQSIANFGGQLDFTIDGINLFDCTTKKAYTNVSGTWEVIPAFFPNVPGDVYTYQAITPDTTFRLGTTQLYTEGDNKLTTNTVNMDDFKILHLSTAAVINLAHTTISQVTGANEVFGANWPQGGLALGPATITTLQAQIDYSYADVDRDILFDTLNIGYSIVYEATTNLPLIAIDWGGIVTVPGDMHIKIAELTGKLITYKA